MHSRRYSHPSPSISPQKNNKKGRPRSSAPLTNIEIVNTKNYLEQKQRESDDLEKERVENLFSSLKNPNGHQLSQDSNRLLLILIRNIMKNNIWNKTDAIKSVAALVNVSDKTLHSLYNSFLASGKVPSPDTSKTGSGNSNHPRHQTPLTSEMEAAIRDIIKDQNKLSGFCTTLSIQSVIFEKIGEEIPRNHLTRILHGFGLRYGPSRTYGTMELAARKARTTNYIKQLSLALELENLGTHIICYMDESYVNLNHKIRFTWYDPTVELSNEVGGNSGKGERAIIIHSISKFGRVGDKIEEKNLGVPANSAEHFFKGGEVDGDYHKNMNSTLFINWVNNRFIPAFNHKFPHQKCILVLDNAPYHHAKCDEYIKMGTNKSEIIESLSNLKVPLISVTRAGKHTFIPPERWGNRVSMVFPYAPSFLELKDNLEIHIKNNEKFQITEIEKKFNFIGWQIIWTPPYTPETQPIEKIWAFIKNYIANNNKCGRKMDKLLKLITKAFYGNNSGSHQGVTVDLCNKIINHCYNWCNDFIDKNIHSGGNLTSLATYLHENEGPILPSSDESLIIEAEREEEEHKNYDIFDFPSDEDENDV
jgi:hypothetical protein